MKKRNPILAVAPGPQSGSGLAAPWKTSEPAFAALCIIISIGILVYAIMVFLLVPRPSQIDELGLFNPVYMKLHFGHMSYPVHGYFNSMFVHPPVQYLEVAYLMKAGLSLPYAEGLIVCVLTIACPLAILWGRFEVGGKFPLLFGFSTGLFFLAGIFDQTYAIRPDTQIALAWFLGLVLLQDGVNRKGNVPRLAIGSFLLTYASGLHYYAVCAFLGVSYYLLTAWHDLPRRRFRQACAAIIGGACAFGVPYLALFVLPQLHGILAMTHAVQSQGSMWSPVKRHWVQYSYFLSERPRGLRVWQLLDPVLRLKIPLFAVGAAAMAAKKPLRGIALASLPLPAFVFLYSQGKSTGYYLPELMLFFCGLGVFIFAVVERAFRPLPIGIRSWATAGILLLFVFWGTTFGYPIYADAKLRDVPLVAPMDIARACAKQIVGNNATIAGRIGLWYISGAQKWHDVSADLLWKHDISGVNLIKYFEGFDDIVEHNHMSNVTLNSTQDSLGSWYASGVLKLRGFFVTDVSDNMNFLIFTTLPSKTVGYVFNQGKILRFDEGIKRTSVFVSTVCPFESWPPLDRFHLPLFNAIYLPKALPSGAPSKLPQAKTGDPQSAIVTSVMTPEEFAEHRPSLEAQCKQIDVRYGALTEQNTKALLTEWRASERPMTFYPSADTAVAERYRGNTIYPPSFNTNHLEQEPGGVLLSGDAVKTIRTPREAYAFAAVMSVPDGLPGRSWVAVRERVTKGQIGVAILDNATNQYLSQQFLDSGDSQTVYLALGSNVGRQTLIIQNGTSTGPSQVEIQDVHVIYGEPGANKESR